MTILLCLALHLYHGPVGPTAPLTVLSAQCSPTTLPAVQSAVQACLRAVDVCELLTTPDHTILLEWKVTR